MRAPSPSRAALVAALVVGALAGCAGGGSAQVADRRAAGATASASPGAADPSAAASARPPSAATGAPSAPPVTPAEPAPAPPAAPAAPAAPASPDVTTEAALTIPAIGVDRLRVVPYVGSPDDGPGTDIQNGGVAASPRGPAGGVGPGEVGNTIITAHRLSAGGPLLRLPELRDGDRVLLEAAGVVHEYVVTGTLEISFRSEASKALQAAPVPGQPGVPPVQPMITLSTCATPEDRAAGNTWTDEFGNPEHRIDKIGVLVASTPA